MNKKLSTGKEKHYQKLNTRLHIVNSELRDIITKLTIENNELKQAVEKLNTNNQMLMDCVERLCAYSKLKPEELKEKFDNEKEFAESKRKVIELFNVLFSRSKYQG